MDQEHPIKIPPYKVLFVQNIPASYTSEKLIKEWNVAGLVFEFSQISLMIANPYIVKWD